MVFGTICLCFQTKTERSKKDRIKEKRKAALEARLAKVKQRRKLKTGDLEGKYWSGRFNVRRIQYTV